MNLINETRLLAGYATALDKSGREWLVVVAKGTYAFPSVPTAEPKLLKEQAPLVMVDEFTGEPAFSAPLYESDFAARKPRCDVLLNGSAYAPGGRPAARVTVGIRLGALVKSFDVVGNRVYQVGFKFATSPEPFTVMPISYDNAFGGVDRTDPDEKKHRWNPLNHAGVGYYPAASVKALMGKPLPNTEQTGRPINQAKGSYQPMAFGPVGRAWQPRPKLAGSYDQRWLDEKFPFLPDDFDDTYFQSAPADQQIDYPRGGEEVVLKNLTAQGETAFRLPRRLGLPVLFLRRDGVMTEAAAVVDTIILEPDKSRLMLVWRASLALRRNLREINEIVLNCTSMERSRQDEVRRRRAAKRRFRSLAEWVAWKKGRRNVAGIG